MNEEIKIVKNEEGGYDLHIGNKTIVQTGNIIESHVFWDEVEGCSNVAMYKIEQENPEMSFNFNIFKKEKSKEEQKKDFLVYMKEKHPNINVEKAYELIDEQISKIKFSGPVEENTNPYFKFSINSDIIKAIFMEVIENYINVSAKLN